MLVQAFHLHQLMVRPHGNHSAPIKHSDDVGIPDGRQAVGDDDRCTTEAGLVTSKIFKISLLLGEKGCVENL